VGKSLIRREWAMPNKNTFDIPPISALLDKWVNGARLVVDPFARDSKRALLSNDLNPNTSAKFHMEATAFLDHLIANNVVAMADAVLFDPPYSPRQISECYKAVGLDVGMKETQNARLYKTVRDGLDKVLKPGGIAVSCGWNSAGFGDGRGYKVEEILLVAHGGAHNDTIVVVERKNVL
jgi:hypothetical protein